MVHEIAWQFECFLISKIEEWPLECRNWHGFKMDKHYSTESGYPEIQDCMELELCIYEQLNKQ